MKYINIGYGNVISIEKIVSIVSPDGAPIKRLITDARADGRLIDASCGRKTKAVIITSSSHIVLSSIAIETLKNRLNNEDDNDGLEESADN